MKILVFAFASICLLACNDDANKKADYRPLPDRLNAIEARMDSLISVIKEREPLKKTSPRKAIKAKKKSKSTDSYLSIPAESNKSEQTWKSVNNQTTPTYQPVKEKEVYKVRVGAICCDGSRSNATGRGACSHHGGVCEWLYQ
jgi:hypothetical protein